jgi:hypothetical protein
MDPESAHERRKANPDSGDLASPTNVWKDAETTPQQDSDMPGRRGGGDRVADAGDIGSGSTSPYGTATQADQVAGQTKRRSNSDPTDR